MSYHSYPKRNPIHDCFLMPNEIFNLGLPHGAIAVYAFLLRCEDRKTYRCHPGYKAIGKALGMSANTVRKYVAVLEESCLIRTEPTTINTRAGRRNGSLRYSIRPIQEAVDCFHERQLCQAERTLEKHKAEKVLTKYKEMRQARADSHDEKPPVSPLDALCAIFGARQGNVTPPHLSDATQSHCHGAGTGGRKSCRIKR